MDRTQDFGKIPAAGICDHWSSSIAGGIFIVSDGTGRKYGSGWYTGDLCTGKFCLWICGRQRNKEKEDDMGNGGRYRLLSVPFAGVNLFWWNSVSPRTAFNDICPVSGRRNAGRNPVLKMGAGLAILGKICYIMSIHVSD